MHGSPGRTRGRDALVGAVATGAFVVLSAYTIVAAPAPKLLGISWVAFGAMAGAALLGVRTAETSARGLVWSYGLASGAMVTSAAVFLVPDAIEHHRAYGGFGIALGLLVGFAGHSVGHRLTHLDLPLDRTVAALSAHALAAGTIIGVVYGAMPELGPVLGLAIVSHKGPAGYAAARRLAGRGRTATGILLPASGVGLTALTVSLFSIPAAPVARGIVFGFAAGVFLHVAMDFLPQCEQGSEIHEAIADGGAHDRDSHDSHDAHQRLDELRVQAVASTAVGGLAVFLAWLWLVG